MNTLSVRARIESVVIILTSLCVAWKLFLFKAHVQEALVILLLTFFSLYLEASGRVQKATNFYQFRSTEPVGVSLGVSTLLWVSVVAVLHQGSLPQSVFHLHCCLTNSAALLLVTLALSNSWCKSLVEGMRGYAVESATAAMGAVFIALMFGGMYVPVPIQGQHVGIVSLCLCEVLGCHFLASSLPGSFTPGEIVLLSGVVTWQIEVALYVTVTSGGSGWSDVDILVLALTGVPLLYSALGFHSLQMLGASAVQDTFQKAVHSRSTVQSVSHKVDQDGSTAHSTSEKVGQHRSTIHNSCQEDGTVACSDVVSKGYHLAYLIALLLVAVVGTPIWIHSLGALDGWHPVVWMAMYVLSDGTRLGLAVYWVLLLSFTVVVCLVCHRSGGAAVIVLRKAFHLLAVVMFTPAFILEAEMMRLSFGVAFFLLVALEICRIARVPMIGSGVHRFMKPFTDERDTDSLFLSHFSLLVGIAGPIWMVPSSKANSTEYFDDQNSSQAELALRLAAASGLVSLGAIDTAASVIGYKFGRIKLCRGCSKTVEGLSSGILAGVVATVLYMSASQAGAWNFGFREVFQIAVVSAGTGFLEAFTAQMDNVFVPLHFYVLSFVMLHT